MSELQKHCGRLKKAGTKEYIAHDSTYMTFWKRQNYRGGKQISGCQNLGMERVRRRGLDQKGAWGNFSG